MSALSELGPPPLQGFIAKGQLAPPAYAWLSSLQALLAQVDPTLDTYLTEATAAQYWASTAGLLGLTPETIAASTAYQTLTDAATIAVDFNAGYNFVLSAMAGNRTLGNPTNFKIQAGCIGITASGADRILSFDTNWRKLSNNIVTPITILSGQRCDIFYYGLVTGRPCITGYGNQVVNA